MAKKGWRSSPAFRAVGALMFLGGAVGALIWSLTWVSHHHYPMALVALGLASFLLCLGIALTLMLFGLVGRQAHCDGRGTTFEPDAVQSGLNRCLFICVALTSALVVLLVVTGRLPMPTDSHDQRSVSKAIGGAIFMLLFSLALAPRWLSPGSTLGYLRLSPRGIAFSTGGRATEIDWDELVDVTDEAKARYRIVDVANFHTEGGSAGWIPARSYSADPEALNAVVRYYWRHPDRRTELADGRAAHRWVTPARDGLAVPTPGRPTAPQLLR